jgi:CheY-like chemotaxis protein
MVDKIVAYETTPNDKTWQKNTLLIADNQVEAYEAEFEIMNEEAAMLLPASMNVPVKGYLNDYLTSAALRDDIKATIDAGTLIVNYSGHGSLQQFAGESIFRNSDVDDLTNTGKYPFVISMTCLTGYFGYLDPQDGPEPSLAEALLLADGKGAVASLMPTAMTSTSGQRILDTALFESIFTKDIRQLGPAVVDAKQTLLANGGTAFEEISETFLLFGDPALTLQVPIPHKPSEVEVQQVEEGILISWQSVEDCDGNPVAGYNLYRSPSAGGIYTKVNGILITDTEYLDTDPAGISAQDVGGSGTGSYFYGVTSVDSGGDESAQSLAISPPSLATIPGAEDVGAASCFIDTSTSPAEFNITFKALIAIVSIILVFVLLQSIFDPSRKKNTAEKKMNPFNELKNVKTLLVDDDEFIRNSLELAFKTKGCCLKVAETAEEGLQAIKAHQFDIIISDFRLPGMNGLEFLKLAAVTQPQAVKFLITAYRDDHIFSEAVRLGVNEFIEKPFAVKVLINLLALALKRQEKTRSAIM